MRGSVAKALAFGALVSLAIMASGCASEPIRKISKDTASSAAKAKGIVVYRVHATARDLVPRGSPYLILDKVGERLGAAPEANAAKLSSVYANNQDKRDFWSGKSLEAAWKGEGEVLSFDDLIFAEAEPGTYHIREIYQPMGSYSYSSGVNSTTTVTNWLDVWLDTAFTVEAGQGIDLGIVDVAIQGQKNDRFSYTCSIRSDPAKASDTADTFANSYPGVALGLAGPIGPARLFHYEDLQQRSSQEGAVNYIHKLADDGKLQALATKKGSSVPAGLPFSLEWTAMWKEGSVEKPFGMYLGRNADDAFLFGITEGRRAVVQRLVNGGFQAPLIDTDAPSVRLGSARLRNVCRVDVAQGLGRLYVNDALVGEFPCDGDFSNGICGYFALGSGIIDFGSPRLVETAP